MALMRVFGILEEKRLRWQRVRTRAEDIAWIEKAVRSFAESCRLDDEPIRVKSFEEALVSPVK